MRWSYLLILLLALPFAAHGELLPDGGLTAPEVAAALKHAGYPADVTADKSGTPSIHSSTGKELFEVRFFQCGAQLRCTSIQLTAQYRHKLVSSVTIAAWNRERRFARAFQDIRGVAWVAMDVEASHGITTEALAANIDRWIAVMNGFDAFVGR